MAQIQRNTLVRMFMGEVVRPFSSGFHHENPCKAPHLQPYLGMQRHFSTQRKADVPTMKFRNMNLNIGRSAQFSEFVQNILGRRTTRFSIPVDFSAQEFFPPSGLGNKPNQLQASESLLARKKCPSRLRRSHLDPRVGPPLIGL